MQDVKMTEQVGCMCMYVLRATISAEIALLSSSLDTCVCYCHFDLS